VEAKNVAKTALIGFVLVLAVFIAAYFFMRQIDTAEPNACISEEKMTVPDLSGTKIEVVYTNCDTLAKTESISIYFSQAKRKSRLAQWQDHRALVFRYDPGRYDNPLPSITRPSPSTILISIPEVSSILYQSRDWEDISVVYNLGKMDYSANPK
jgi:hypothetical protein